jgi:hypothetical protein
LSGLLALLLVVPALQADDKPADKPADKSPDKAKETPPTPSEQYKALDREFREAQKKFFKEYNEAKTPEEKQKVLQEKSPSPAKYASRFLELAEKNPKDPAAVDALIWVMRNSQGGAAGGERTKALTILKRDYLTSEKVVNICDSLVYQTDADSESFLRTLMEKSPAKDVQGRACLALAMHLQNRQQRNRSANTAETEKAYKEVESLLGLAVAKYSDVKHPFYGAIGAKAENILFEIRYLRVGKEAPDIAGEDQDGKKFKLSDYRGKVVLIDFWGNW